MRVAECVMTRSMPPPPNFIKIDHFCPQAQVPRIPAQR
jgi:hypothetical protein